MSAPARNLESTMTSTRTITAQTDAVVSDAHASLMIAFDGAAPTERSALKWLSGYYSMNVEMSGLAALFDDREDFYAAVAAAESRR